MGATCSWSLGSYQAWETVLTRSSNYTSSLALWVPAEPNMQNDRVLSQPVSLHHILLCWFRSAFLTRSLNWFAQLSSPARGDFSLCVQMSHKHCLHLRLPGLNPWGPQLFPRLSIPLLFACHSMQDEHMQRVLHVLPRYFHSPSPLLPPEMNKHWAQSRSLVMVIMVLKRFVSWGTIF